MGKGGEGDGVKEKRGEEREGMRSVPANKNLPLGATSLFKNIKTVRTGKFI